MEYNMNSEQKRATALPAQFCMICLNVSEHCKLYPANRHNLDVQFEHFTGISLKTEARFVPQCCVECATRLNNCSKFRDRTQRAYSLLLVLLETHETLTIQNIRNIDRKHNHLESSLSKKVYQPNHYDLCLSDVEIEYNTLDNRVKEEVITFEEAPTYVDVKCENFNDNAFEAIDISINKNDDEQIKNTIDDSKNDDYDIDFETCDEIEKDTENVLKVGTNKKHATKKIKNSKNTVSKLKVEKKQIKNETRISSKEKPKKKKRLKNDKKEISADDKLVPGTKLQLKVCKEIELTQEQQVAEILKRKESKNYTSSWFKCTVCYKGFHRLDPYNAHLDRHTDKFGVFECDICKVRFKSKGTLRKHVTNHRSTYECTQCAFVSHHRAPAVLHERWHQGKLYTCTHCRREFAKFSSLMSHVRIKHPSDFVCTQCGFSFIGERGLRSHMDKKHSFVDTENLTGPLCAPCNIRFASEKAYKHHMQASPKHAAAGQLKPNCPMQTYMSRKEISIDCEQCGVKLEGVRRYAIHFRTQHPDKTRTQFLKDKDSLNKPRSMCEQCGKVYEAPALLRAHMQVHTGIKLYKCDICDKGFMSNMSRRVHMSRHTEKPSFPCNVCHRVFSILSNQRRHMQLHQATRPLYKCDDCAKTFTTTRGRDLHISHVHLNVPWPKRVRGKRSPNKTRRYSANSDSQEYRQRE